MSTVGDLSEDDAELKDVVFKELESSGILAKIKAELMASVFITLEKGDGIKKIPLANKGLKDFLDTADGELCYSVVKEFLEFHQLTYTATILGTETGMGGNRLSSRDVKREDMAREFNLTHTDMRPSYSMLRNIATHCKGTTPRGYSHVKPTSTEFTPVLSKNQIENIKNMFNTRDKDSDGFLSRDEVSELLCDLCPKFNKEFLLALCESEMTQLSAASSSLGEPRVSLAQFNSMYQRFHTSCYTVITDNSKVKQHQEADLNGHPGDEATVGSNVNNRSLPQSTNDYSFEIDEELDVNDDNTDVSGGGGDSNSASPQAGPVEEPAIPQGVTKVGDSDGIGESGQADDYNDLLLLGDDLSTDRTISEAQAPASFDFVENIP